MNSEDVHTLSQSGTYQGAPLQGNIEETHISWVILSGKFAFKIKKPVKQSFLDFSSLAARKRLCEKELQLNQRFSRIYLDVLPVWKDGNQWYLGEGQGEVVDYAVQMERMDEAKKMDKLLKQGKVTTQQVQALAKALSAFHSRAALVSTPTDVNREKSIFNDIQSVSAFVKDRLGQPYAALIDEAIIRSNAFLETYEPRMQERITQGFKRDVHGDLHSGNVFLYSNPVLIDCIEFNDSYRQIDLLHEVAFMCMDLEAAGKHGLSEAFLSAYLLDLPCMQTAEDEQLFLYYKCCRANVRAKVHALGAMHSTEGTSFDQSIKRLRSYLSVMKSYLNQLSI